jgi:FkbM family methyltransferase
MDAIAVDSASVWSGDGVLSQMILAYARRVPRHRGKIRIFNTLAQHCFPCGLPFKNQDGVRILANPLDVIGHVMSFHGSYEPLSMMLARRLMSCGGTFVDIGANIGLYTCSIGAIPNVQCVAFDACATAFVKLLENLRRNPGISVAAVNIALGRKQTILQIERVVGDLGSTRVSTASRAPGTSHYVAALSLDEIMNQLPVGPIRLLKIDIEGYELEVFRGMNFDSMYRPKNIIMEYTERVARNADLLKESFELLCNKRYEALTVTGEKYDSSVALPEENLWWRSL